jgi:hypothetical protein
MEYLSEKARWRAHYRTLREWVGLVRRASACSAKRAQQQISDGLFDGKFAARWEDQGKGALRDPADPDLPPQKGAFWRSAQINWRTGKVYDDWGVTEEGRALGAAYWRRLLLTPKGDSVFEKILRSSIPSKTEEISTPNVVQLHPQSEAGVAISAKADPARQGHPGRKSGSGSIDDEEKLRRMLTLLAVGKVPSVLAAAKAVADATKPNQSVDSEVVRLRRKFAKRWGTEPPNGKTWADVEHELNPN